MKKLILNLALGAALLSTAATHAYADLVPGAATVLETSVSPGLTVNINANGFYSGGALAGVYHLQITQGLEIGNYSGFCIDPFHYSPTVADKTYAVTTLYTAGYSPDIAPAKRTLINQLLNNYYTPGMSNGDAAKLQVAIWETVGGTHFSAQGIYSDSWYNTYIAAAAGAATTDHLVVHSREHQDYVLVDTVPDGGATAALFGLGVLGVAAVRRRLS